MKNGGFRRVGEGDVTIISLQIFDLVFLQTARGAEVEVAGVFITKGAIFNFSALPPIGSSVKILLAQMSLGQGSESGLKGGESAVFFELIQKGDDRTTVEKIDGWHFPFPSPSSSRGPNSLEPEAEFAHMGKMGVGRGNAVPVGGYKGRKGGMG
jgi:hypothetical protein